MRYSPEHKASTRERVLHAAATLLRREGTDRVGVAAVMADAGLTHGGFYAHFASRDELLAAAVAYMFEKPAARFLADATDDDPRAGLRRFVDRYLTLRHRDSREAGCPIPILAGELHRLPPAARDPFVAGTERMIGGITTLLERAGVDDARARASSGFAEMFGAVTLSRAQPDAAVAQALLDHTRASVAARFGLGVSPPARS